MYLPPGSKGTPPPGSKRPQGSFEHSDTLVGKHRTFGEDGGPCGENMVYSEGREGAANMSGKDFHIRGLNPVGPSNF